MTPLVTTLLATAGLVLCGATCLWLASLLKRDASIADIGWGAGFAAIAWLAWSLERAPNARGTLLTVLATMWALRLAGHLLYRNWGHAEDRRYAAMRQQHGPRFWWISFFTVFLLQGVLQWFISLPLQFGVGNAADARWNAIDGIGIALWLVGLCFETIGDWQLARFKADPANRGHVMDRGLWRYTRHPNYFGDFCVWWGLYLIAANNGGVWTIASPIAMTWLLLRVSGVALLEKDIADRRPGYAEYARRTNAFFPGPPR